MLAAVAAALVAADVVALGGGLAPAREAAPGCGAPARPAAAGILWHRLSDGRTSALVTADPRRLAHPAVSPDGRLVAFLSRSNGIVATLRVCDLARRTTRTVAMPIPAGNFPLSWERGGRHVVFLGGDLLGWGADQRPYVVGVSGRGLRQLAGNAPWYYDGAALSPDGRRLALLLQWKYPHGHEPEQLVVLDVRTGKLERVAGSSQVAEIDALSWSPDGTRIAFSAYRPNEHGGLYAVDVATRRLTPLLIHGPGAVDPAWSPDGRSIAFVRPGVRSSSIWLLDLRSGRARRVTRGGDDLAPAWSPDGKALVFVRRAAA